MEPGVEPVRITKTGQVAPGANERVLDRVARELRVPEDEARGRVQPGGRRRGEHGKGVVIAPRCPLDECPLVHGPSPSSPTTVAGFEGYGVAGCRFDAQESKT